MPKVVRIVFQIGLAATSFKQETSFNSIQFVFPSNTQDMISKLLFYNT